MEARAANAEPVNARELKILVKHWRRVLHGEPFLDNEERTSYTAALYNVFMSRCYTCAKVALWLHDRILYPSALRGPSPNPDLPLTAFRDFEEARAILDQSPRGAAALLRLAVEKICSELGAEGSRIDDKIADLVLKGLPKTVQQALDIVRVIGNEAVHPGQIDLSDDRETALRLFHLVNFIAEDRITRPKQIEGLYAMIPNGKRQHIEERNAKARKDKPRP